MVQNQQQNLIPRLDRNSISDQHSSRYWYIDISIFNFGVLQNRYCNFLQTRYDILIYYAALGLSTLFLPLVSGTSKYYLRITLVLLVLAQLFLPGFWHPHRSCTITTEIHEIIVFINDHELRYHYYKRWAGFEDKKILLKGRFQVR